MLGNLVRDMVVDWLRGKMLHAQTTLHEHIGGLQKRDLKKEILELYTSSQACYGVTQMISKTPHKVENCCYQMYRS